jgi:hypothetical protein
MKMSEVFCADNRFLLSYETHRGNVFLHCTVHKWSKSTYIAIDAALEVLKEELLAQGVSQINVAAKKSDRKLHRFCKMFGFVTNNVWEDYLVLSKSLEN